MKEKKYLPRLPKKLAEELDFALFCLRDLERKQIRDLLKKYQRNRVRCIAKGIDKKYLPPEVSDSESTSVKGFELIPAEHCSNIERLDEVIQKLRDYHNGGAGDYVAAGVERALNSARAKKPRKCRVDDQEICEYLIRREYKSSDDKASLVKDACDYFGVGASKVNNAASECGLTRKKLKKSNCD